MTEKSIRDFPKRFETSDFRGTDIKVRTPMINEGRETNRIRERKVYK